MFMLWISCNVYIFSKFGNSFAQVIGNLITGSGWEEVVFLSGLAQSGSLLAVIAGSQYNRAWILHSSKSFHIGK